MSVRSLTSLAVERDRAPKGAPALGGRIGTPPVADARGVGATPAPAIPQSFVDTLTSAIPTEPLAAYTAVVGTVTSAIGTDTRGFLAFRWYAFAGFLVLVALAVIVSYRVKAVAPSAGEPNASRGNQRPAPWLELGTALVAAATWGLAMPGGPLGATLTGPAEAIGTGTTTVLGAALVTIAANALRSGTKVDRSPDAGSKAAPVSSSRVVDAAPG